MKKVTIALALLFGLAKSYPDENEESLSTVVLTCYGRVSGRILSSRNGRPFYAYKGIPFAKPPVGDLRFRAPVPPESWTGVRVAKQDGEMCIQKNYLFHEHPQVEGKEDCLYLNVYTPKIPATKMLNLKKPQQLLPVMVNIHFGAFLAGTGNSNYMGPEYIMDKNVVLVTFNYRLGVFGFLSTNDDAAPGNWGLKDQVAALKWVQDNIDAFGGDKNRVTIFGESAGAGSVHLHLLTSTTKGLFHQAISQSGSALSLWGRPFNAAQAYFAKKQADYVRCDSRTDSETMIACLRTIDAAILADSADKFKEFSSEPLTVYGPVTEKRTALNPKPFLLKDPLEIIKNEEFQKVPWVLGVVSDEGILRAAPFLRNPESRKQLNAHFNQYGPIMFGLTLSVSDDDKPVLWKNISKFYLDAEFVDHNARDKVQGFINMVSDRAFKYGSYQSALYHAWKNHSTVWFYNFDYRGEYSYGDVFAGTKDDINFDWGVCHADDLLYLFSTPAHFGPLQSESDLRLSSIMTQMWTDFAIKGDPSPKNGCMFPWSPIGSLGDRAEVTNSDLPYLDISGSSDMNSLNLQMKRGFIKERMQFWESLPLAENIKGIK